MYPVFIYTWIKYISITVYINNNKKERCLHHADTMILTKQAKTNEEGWDRRRK